MNTKENSGMGEEHLQLLQSIVPELIEKAAELKFAKENRTDLWSVLLYATILELSNSACRLISCNEPTGSRTMARMALEAYVDLSNIVSDDDYVSFLDVGSLEEWQKTFRLAESGNVYFRDLCDEPGFHEEVAREAERLADLKNDGYRILRVRERFERANMGDDYGGLYHWLCSDTHNSLRGLSIRHIEHQDNETYEIHILKDEPLGMQLPVISALLNILIASSKMIHTKFGKSQESIDEIAARVSAIEGTS